MKPNVSLDDVSSHSIAMCSAASEGNLEAIRRLHEEHAADINALDSNMRTPLHLAVSKKEVEMTRYLLQCGANVNALDRWGRSPIDYAMETKNIAIVRVLEREHYGRFSLIEDNAMSSGNTRKTRRHHSNVDDIKTYFQAVNEGNIEQIKRSWLSGMEVNVVDELGRTSLHVAIEKGQVGVIELLLSAGVNINQVDAKGRLPISIAQEKHEFAISEMLRAYQKKERTSHEIMSSEEEQNVALAFRVTKQGDTEKLQRLVPEIVRPDIEDYDLRTLLHVASAEGHLQIAKHLVDCGANVNSLDRWGSSPLSDAVNFAHNELAKFLIANRATESGFKATVAVDDIDTATLAGALDFTLRVITRDPWLIGQVHCPVLDDDGNCILVAHSLWQKSCLAFERQSKLVLSPRASNNRPITMASLRADAIQMYRKVSSTVMIDPGQGHIGNVFSGQHPEWLDLHAVQQSQFFLLPHARRAGIQTVVSIPMICKMSTVAVLTLSSDRAMTEDRHELQRIQRVIRSVVMLSTLRQELLNAASCNIGVGRIPRFQYCQILDDAITASGELTDLSTLRKEDLNVCDTTPLALEWGLFDMVDTLATSVSSEDHAAVVPILRSLVMLLHKGLFNDVLRDHNRGEYHEHSGNSFLKHLVELCDGKIRTKWALLGHVKYYVQYLYAVTPTEAELFADVHELFDKVERCVKKQSAGGVSSGDTDVTETNAGQTTLPPAESTPAAALECVLCKYNVPGHIHPGREPTRATPAPERTPQFQTKTYESPQGEKFFGHIESPKSPVYRQIEQLLEKLEGEYDTFKRKAELADCYDEGKSVAFTVSDLYDAIGFAHDTPVTCRRSLTDNPRITLLDVINKIMHDTSCVITRDHLFALHQCLLPVSSGQAGILRTTFAVGYASSRIYRVFIPAGEIEDALDNFIHKLNDVNTWTHRPLLCAYYAFAVLVFYIHPFHDGNGRCARLLGNLVCKKLGFPPLLRAADKTMQLAEFLQKAIVTMEIIRNSRRQTRQTRVLSTRKENSSMWF
ncbi:unnamed protein product [Peronospora belbahrii]|uniref:Fido domain-containing protein n=1 Tax=Peronospora belbahrii TaxID=622444 RepID=A0AAU9KQJ9_9STRA|nr:unnamed protein product [Peronospora belbahrii]